MLLNLSPMASAPMHCSSPVGMVSTVNSPTMSSVSLNAQHGEVFSGNAATSILCFPFLDDSAATGINGDQNDKVGKDSAATGIHGDQNNNSAPGSGAVYLY